MLDQYIQNFTACLLAILVTFAIFALVRDGTPTVPACVEDSVIVGFGEYENGYWTHYSCGPAVDDYAGH